MTALGVGITGLAALVWLGLLLNHGGFWRLREWLPRAAPRRAWPAVAAIIPARDEEDTIQSAVESVLGQRYAGPLHLVVVDDESSDATADRARAGARAIARAGDLTVVRGTPPQAGWTGKLWALERGRRTLDERGITGRYIWLTDADVRHGAGTLERLVAHAEDDRRDLVSLMVRLSTQGVLPRLLVPAFVYFFRKLYPFARVNDPGSRVAGAAGGCMLVDRAVLAAAGGFGAVRDRLIDDCALAEALARAGSGRIWLGMTGRSHSLRPVRGLRDVWHMVARTAYTQLGNRITWLAGTVAGMGLLYGVPPAAVLTWPWHGVHAAGVPGLVAWAAMTVTFVPTLRAYGRTPAAAPLLPAAGFLYTLMTLDSARRHHLGRGGQWKGRAQAHAAETDPPSGERPGAPL